MLGKSHTRRSRLRPLLLMMMQMMITHHHAVGGDCE
jgi:hypothetical protein